MPIKRPLVAVTLAMVVALAGCASGDGQDTDAEDQPGESAIDGAPEGEMELPEADVEGIPDVVAEVNGEEIPQDEFITNYEGQFQQAAMSQQMSGEEPDQDQLKQQVVEQMVNTVLLVQAAGDAGIEATDADIDAGLEDVAAQFGLDSVDEVISTFAEQGFSEEDLRSDVATQFEVETYIEQEAKVDDPDDEELRELYDAVVEQQSAEPQEQAEEIPPFEDVRDELAAQVNAEKTNDAVGEILESLRKDADITIHL